MDHETITELSIFEDLDELSRSAAFRIAEVAREVVQIQGRFTLCLSGGNTPQGVYALLAEDPLRSSVPWERTHIFWGDERCVPLDRPDNHFTMATGMLLGTIEIPPENIHRMHGEADNPQQAAREYDAMLRDFFDLRSGAFPRFDLILLGMGEDGHTASLYPGTPAQKAQSDLVVAQYVPQRSNHRLTLTFPVLNNAAMIMFLAAGRSKAEALRAVLQNKEQEPAPPARLVKLSAGRVVWMVDRLAAGLLDSDEIKTD